MVSTAADTAAKLANMNRPFGFQQAYDAFPFEWSASIETYTGFAQLHLAIAEQDLIWQTLTHHRLLMEMKCT